MNDRRDGRNVRRRMLSVLPALTLACLVAAPASADLFSTEQFKIFADFRARMEADWDSQTSGGTMRTDRDRFRIRARLGVQYDPSERVSFGLRLRTGSDDSQQSPHITLLDFDDNSTGDAHVNLDKWYLRGQAGRVWGWAGRNSLPFWKQNELFWDDDVTPAGLAGGFKTGVGENGSIAINAGLVSLPAGMRNFVGDMALGQVVYSTKIGEGAFTVAGGLLSMDGEEGSPSEAAMLLLNGNGNRDYRIFVGSIQGKLPAGKRTITLGADVMRNEEDYPDVDPMTPGSPEQFSFDHRDETDGYVFSLFYGGGKNKGDWLAGYYYAHIETLAVNNSHAQDDWVRWGSSSQTRGSNMEGHEFRFVYNLGKKTNLVARLYVVEAIVGVEDGNRFRIDLNRKL